MLRVYIINRMAKSLFPGVSGIPDFSQDRDSLKTRTFAIVSPEL